MGQRSIAAGYLLMGAGATGMALADQAEAVALADGLDDDFTRLEAADIPTHSSATSRWPPPFSSISSRTSRPTMRGTDENR